MSLLCAYCLKRPRLGGFVRPTSPAGPWILIGAERLPAGMVYCAEHPIALQERCRCGAEHFRLGTEHYDAAGQRIRWCPGCETHLSYGDGAPGAGAQPGGPHGKTP